MRGAEIVFLAVGTPSAHDGSADPKDVKAVMATARESGGSLEILEAVHRVNERQKAVLAEKIIRHFGGDLAGKRIALWACRSSLAPTTRARRRRG